MTAIINRSTHSVSLLDGEIVEENDFGSIRRVPPTPSRSWRVCP
jgi:oxalate decarboxylase